VQQQEKPGEKVRIQQILFATPPDTTPKQVEKLTSQLEEIRAKIMAGDDFGQMAAKHSQDPSAKEGGDLGYFGRESFYPLSKMLHSACRQVRSVRSPGHLRVCIL